MYCPFVLGHEHCSRNWWRLWLHRWLQAAPGNLCEVKIRGGTRFPLSLSCCTQPPTPEASDWIRRLGRRGFIGMVLTVGRLVTHHSRSYKASISRITFWWRGTLWMSTEFFWCWNARSCSGAWNTAASAAISLPIKCARSDCEAVLELRSLLHSFWRFTTLQLLSGREKLMCIWSCLEHLGIPFPVKGKE